MKIVSSEVYLLRLPLVGHFTHALYRRDHSESVVVQMTTDEGISGFGEGAPRSYVTGESLLETLRHIADHLLPPLMAIEIATMTTAHALDTLAALMERCTVNKPTRRPAARCAVELALLDCLLRGNGMSLADILPPRRDEVVYSGVIGADSPAEVEQTAQRCKVAGFAHVKMKVMGDRDASAVATVRDILGPDVSLRLDANGAFDRALALRFLREVARHDIACMEQPIPAGDVAEWAALRRESPVPIMADESLVCLDDARCLIEHRAADYFNLRLSKCGGMQPALEIATLASESGIGLQVGCQVGETAILSAAGRHLAAYLPAVRFVEGSYGTHLLLDDIATEDITFGVGGRAPVLKGLGLGITINVGKLRQLAAEHRVIQ